MNISWRTAGRFLRRHWVLEAFLVIMIGFVMTPHSLERLFVYYPSRQILEDPRSIGLNFQEVSLSTVDKIRLHGWFVPCEGARCTLLICHGNAGNIGDRLPYLEIFHELGVHVLVFDYRGYGKSEGKPFEEGLYRDAQAAYAWWARERQPQGEQLVLFGESLGGAVAVNLAANVAPSGLILQSTFTSAKDMASGNMILRLLFPLGRVQFNSAGKIGKVNCPKFFIHGTRDDIVPFRLGKDLYAWAPPPKSFYEVPGAGHNDLLWIAGEEYRQKLKRFMADIR